MFDAAKRQRVDGRLEARPLVRRGTAGDEAQDAREQAEQPKLDATARKATTASLSNPDDGCRSR